ncbi:GNAT family N-acetyltransferase [Mesobacillus foraminis]|uniref:GNAT family N-acetyltransferase n=1 Tax=Mesobacillus foraminis TaxID=279826 RepID=UPI001BE89CA4|nr:GNAT family N-acetyltransferase [Mesobacillus foraminis]MBT2759164.1 GNAT family N-acetyltransferase [Mesobacillus foraminis]
MQTKPYELIAAKTFMLEKINDIYLASREQLFKSGIYQWDDQYPNKEYFQECIDDKTLYVLTREKEILGHVVLNEWEAEEWSTISWTGKNPYIIHSLMIDPSVQGRGLGTEFLKLCEKKGAEKGYDSIRLDAYSGNSRAIKLYKKLGYEEKGSIYFRSKPEGHQEYICFEKIF